MVSYNKENQYTIQKRTTQPTPIFKSYCKKPKMVKPLLDSILCGVASILGCSWPSTSFPYGSLHLPLGPCRAGGTSYQREMNGTDAFELRPMKSQVATKTCRILKPAANPVTKGWEETSGEKSQGGRGPYQEHWKWAAVSLASPSLSHSHRSQQWLLW